MTVRCPVPKCGVTTDNAGLLTAHLVKDHDWNGAEAFSKARDLVGAVTPSVPPAPSPVPAVAAAPDEQQPQPSSREETAMARPCAICKKVGHGKKNCPERPAKRSRKTPPPPASSALARASTAVGDVDANIRTASQVLLTALKAKRDGLDKLIAGIELETAGL